MEWSKEELEAYGVTAGFISLPADVAVVQFLFDAIATKPLPLTWTASRNESGVLMFTNSVTQVTASTHPYDMQMKQLATALRDCITLSTEEREQHVRTLHERWTNECQSMQASILATWMAVQPADKSQVYYFNKETNETVWENPTEVQTAPYSVMLHAIIKLLDEGYVSSLRSMRNLRSGSKGSNSDGSVKQTTEEDQRARARGQRHTSASSNSPSRPSITESALGLIRSRPSFASSALGKIKRPSALFKGYGRVSAAPASSLDTLDKVETRWADGHDQWTGQECSDFLASLGLLEMPGDEAVRRFLLDVLIDATPPLPWIAVRENQNGKALQFKNRSTQEVSSSHPQKHLLARLAATCRECLRMDQDQRYQHIRALHETWAAEAEKEFSKWEPRESKSQKKTYFRHADTGITMWEDPGEVVLPDYHVLLRAIGDLTMADYTERLLSEKGGSTKNGRSESTGSTGLKDRIRRSFNRTWGSSSSPSDSNADMSAVSSPDKAVSSTAPAPVKSPVAESPDPFAEHAPSVDRRDSMKSGGIIEGNARWTDSECRDYVGSLHFARDPAVSQFLHEVLSSTNLPKPWIAIRNAKNVLLFQNRDKGIATTQHPLEHVLPSLAEVCHECLQLGPEACQERIRTVHTAWKAEAQETMQKWHQTVDKATGRQYYFNSETEETMWESPTAALLPAFKVKFEGVTRLLDQDYREVLKATRTEAQQARTGTEQTAAASPDEQTAPAVPNAERLRVPSPPLSAGAISRKSSPSNARFRSQDATAGKSISNTPEDSSVEQWKTFVASSGIVDLPVEAAIAKFLHDVIATLFVKHPGQSRETYENLLRLLARECRECLTLDSAKRHARVTDLHAKWSAEAHSEHAKWQPRVSQSKNKTYYVHADTGETTWDDPTRTVVPTYHIRLEAINKLADVKYLWELKEAEDVSTTAKEISHVRSASGERARPGYTPSESTAKGNDSGIRPTQEAPATDLLETPDAGRTTGTGLVAETRGRSTSRSPRSAAASSRGVLEDRIKDVLGPGVSHTPEGIRHPSNASLLQENAQWTDQERKDYTMRLGLANAANGASILQFLDDVLAVTSIELPWVAVRNDRGALFFKNLSTRAISWNHPHERVLKQLAEVCDECLQLKGAARTQRARSLHTSLSKETEDSLGKWTTKRSRRKNKDYFQNIETGETTWQNPEDVLKPASVFRLSALERLFDETYCDYLQSCLKGPTHSSVSRETTAEPTAPQSESETSSPNVLTTSLAAVAKKDDVLQHWGISRGDDEASGAMQQAPPHANQEGIGKQPSPLADFEEQSAVGAPDDMTCVTSQSFASSSPLGNPRSPSGQQDTQEHHNENGHQQVDGDLSRWHLDIEERLQVLTAVGQDMQQARDEQLEWQAEAWECMQAQDLRASKFQEDAQALATESAHVQEDLHDLRTEVLRLQDTQKSVVEMQENLPTPPSITVMDRDGFPKVEALVQRLEGEQEHQESRIVLLVQRLEDESESARRNSDGLRSEMQELQMQVQSLVSSHDDQQTRTLVAEPAREVGQTAHKDGDGLRSEVQELQLQVQSLLSLQRDQQKQHRDELGRLREGRSRSPVPEVGQNSTKCSSLQSHLLSSLQDEQREMQEQLDKQKAAQRDNQKGYLHEIGELHEEQHEFQMQLERLLSSQRSHQKSQANEAAQIHEEQEKLYAQIEKVGKNSHKDGDGMRSEVQELQLQVQSLLSSQRDQQKQHRDELRRLREGRSRSPVPEVGQNATNSLQSHLQEIVDNQRVRAAQRDNQKGYLHEIVELREEQQEFQMQLERLFSSQRSHQKTQANEAAKTHEEQEKLYAQIEKVQRDHNKADRAEISELHRELYEFQAQLTKLMASQRSQHKGLLDEASDMREEQDNINARLEKMKMSQHAEMQSLTDELQSGQAEAQDAANRLSGKSTALRSQILSEQQVLQEELERQKKIQQEHNSSFHCNVDKLNERYKEVCLELEQKVESQQHLHRDSLSDGSRICDEVAALQSEQRHMEKRLEGQFSSEKDREKTLLDEAAELKQQHKNLQMELEMHSASHRDEQQAHLDQMTELHREHQSLKEELESRLSFSKEELWTFEQTREVMRAEMSQDGKETKEAKREFLEFYESQRTAFAGLRKKVEVEWQLIQANFEDLQERSHQDQQQSLSTVAKAGVKLQKDLEAFEAHKEALASHHHELDRLRVLHEEDMVKNRSERWRHFDSFQSEVQVVFRETERLKHELQDSLDAHRRERESGKAALAHCRKEWEVERQSTMDEYLEFLEFQTDRFAKSYKQMKSSMDIDRGQFKTEAAESLQQLQAEAQSAIHNHENHIVELNAEFADVRSNSERWMKTWHDKHTKMMEEHNMRQENCVTQSMKWGLHSEEAMSQLKEITNFCDEQRTLVQENATGRIEWRAECTAMVGEVYDELRAYQSALAEIHTKHKDARTSFEEELSRQLASHQRSFQLEAEEGQEMQSKLKTEVLAQITVYHQEVTSLQHEGEAVQKQLQAENIEVRQALEELRAQSAANESQREKIALHAEEEARAARCMHDSIASGVTHLEQRVEAALQLQHNESKSLPSSIEAMLQTKLGPMTAEVAESLAEVERQQAQSLRHAQKELQEVRQQVQNEASCLKMTEAEIVKKYQLMEDAMQGKMKKHIQDRRDLDLTSLDKRVEEMYKRLESQFAAQQDTATRDVRLRLADVEARFKSQSQDQQNWQAELHKAKAAELRWQEAEAQNRLQHSHAMQKLEWEQETQKREWAHARNQQAWESEIEKASHLAVPEELSPRAHCSMQLSAEALLNAAKPARGRSRSQARLQEALLNALSISQLEDTSPDRARPRSVPGGAPTSLRGYTGRIPATWKSSAKNGKLNYNA